MNILVIVAARGGSKGVKNKNIRDLAGKLLICHTVEQVEKWGKFNEFVLSTDSDDIAAAVRGYKVKVPFKRPPELAGDSVGKIEVLRHALRESEKAFGKHFDVILDLDVTAPLRRTEDIDNALNLFKLKDADCVFSVVRSRKNPYFNMVEIENDGTAQLCKQPPKKLLRRQDAPVVYAMNTSIYVFKRDFLLNEKNSSVFSGRAYAYEMPEATAFDIDSELDFKFIGFLIKERIFFI